MSSKEGDERGLTSRFDGMRLLEDLETLYRCRDESIDTFFSVSLNVRPELEKNVRTK